MGGAIISGCSTVLIGNQPAARAGDNGTCVGPLNAIEQGSSTVRIGNQPAARSGDPMVHGGKIVKGYPSVLIGG
jgi:uncharacterized Zn-binding protein involved in type VI secretion